LSDLGLSEVAQGSNQNLPGRPALAA